MKKNLLIFAILFGLTMSAKTEEKSKNSPVPNAVKKAFVKEFPKQKAEWSVEKGGFETEFKINSSESFAVYYKNGHSKELETGIKSSELPVNALVY